MSKRLIGVLGATLLLFSLAAAAFGQTVTKVQAVQNSDGTYTIVEYPVGKETIVNLNPIGLSGARGQATILRAADGTKVRVNLSGLPAEATAVNLYAVEPSGAVTMLGPVEVANGAGVFTTSIPLTKFMLVASPDSNLSTYGDSTQVYFRSAVPSGLTLIPLTNAVGETIGAVAAPVTAVTDAVVDSAIADYTVPMLGIGTFKKGDDTKLKINFSGAMEGSRANVFIEPHKHGRTTEVLMRFHDLKEAPKGLAYVLWAVSPDNQFTRLGQIINVKGRNEAEIKSEVAYDDFGLMLTTESLGVTQGTIIRPSGHRVGVIQIVP
ncbi:MAG: hypothetical protein QOF72_2262 [Blastocatellia bacterium]|jgi:hypothetical protein|nr:hypothetical protein [Blastocatellia bacterium]MDX6577373.1 hypothetical protein [Blastocatellia bacterium]